MHVCGLSRFSHVQLFVTPLTAACQYPLSMGFPREEFCSGLPCPPPGDLPNPRIKFSSCKSPALAGEFFTTMPPGKPYILYTQIKMLNCRKLNLKKNLLLKSLCSFFHYVLFNIYNMMILITSQAQFFFFSLQFHMVPASLKIQLKILFVLSFSACLNSSSNSGSIHPVFDFSHRTLCFSSYLSLP